MGTIGDNRGGSAKLQGPEFGVTLGLIGEGMGIEEGDPRVEASLDIKSPLFQAFIKKWA